MYYNMYTYIYTCIRHDLVQAVEIYAAPEAEERVGAYHLAWGKQLRRAYVYIYIYIYMLVNKGIVNIRFSYPSVNLLNAQSFCQIAPSAQIRYTPICYTPFVSIIIIVIISIINYIIIIYSMSCYHYQS